MTIYNENKQCLVHKKHKWLVWIVLAHSATMFVLAHSATMFVLAHHATMFVLAHHTTMFVSTWTKFNINWSHNIVGTL